MTGENPTASELRSTLAYAEEQVFQDPYALPLESIDVANPFLFAHDAHHRWFRRLRR